MKNKIIIICFTFLFVLSMFSCLNFYKNYRNNITLHETVTNECLDNIEAYSSCEDLLKSDSPEFDTFTVFFKIVNEEAISILVYIGPLIIILSSVFRLFKLIHSSYTKNFLLRSNYKQYLHYILKSAYKSIWIIPTIIIIIYIISHLISHNYDYSYAINNSYSTFDIQYLKNFNFFFITYIFNMLLFSIFYANLALLFVKKNKSVIVSIIEAYLTFIGIEIINEVLISDIIFYNLLHIDIRGILNILDIYSYKGVFGWWQYLLVGFGYCILSILAVFFVYKSKENTIREIEEIGEE